MLLVQLIFPVVVNDGKQKKSPVTLCLVIQIVTTYCMLMMKQAEGDVKCEELIDVLYLTSAKPDSVV